MNCPVFEKYKELRMSGLDAEKAIVKAFQLLSGEE